MSLEEITDLEGYFSDTDPEVLPEEIKQEDTFSPTTPSPNLKSILLVSNIPKVPLAKAPKLISMLTKLFSSFGTLVNSPTELSETFTQLSTKGIFVPFKEKVSEPFAYIFFSTSSEASAAISARHNYKLDKSHTFKVYSLFDLQTFLHSESPPAEISLPDPLAELPENESKQQELESWQLDSRGRDQYLVRYAQETEVYYTQGISGVTSDGAVQPGIQGLDVDPSVTTSDDLVFNGAKEKSKGLVLTDGKVSWSPSGKYLVTWHRPGLALWGGRSDDWEKLGKLRADGVKKVEWNLQETRILAQGGDDGWMLLDVNSGKLIRKWGGSGLMEFTGDGKSVVKLLIDGIGVWSAVDGVRVGSKAIYAKDVQGLSCCKRGNNVFAYWQAGNVEGGTPGSVSLLNVEKGKVNVLKKKQVFHLKDVELHWQHEGQFLCAEVLRNTKSGKSTFTALEFFKLDNLLNVRNQTLEIREHVHNFAFEGGLKKDDVGNRFSVATVENVSFYEIQRNQLMNIRKVAEADRSILRVTWSPRGEFFTFDSFDKDKPEIEFGSLKGAELRLLRKVQHFKAKAIAWSPSGLIVASVGMQRLYGDSIQSDKLENGFSLWSFLGSSLLRRDVQDLYFFEWRPWSRVVESEVAEADVPTEALEKYVEEDRLRRERRKIARDVDRLQQLKEFRAIRDKLKVVGETHQSKDSQPEFVEVVVTIETFLSEREEAL
eukprot:snap_masked-scaffold_14-processed-gene-10.44-mRNA-1 protein AED:1.00 eAED:1.00 QI:0/-1/0/0/-1/1/1/0/713